MFTGIIEEQGIINKINRTSNGMDITVECKVIPDDVILGSSICVNGVCETVIDFGKDFITVQASNETLNVTNFKYLKKGDYVNLERALTLSKRLDGHIVSGHVDTIGEFVNKQDDGFSKRFFFKIPDNFSKYVIYKGSIAVNGVSLTVASIENNIFSVELIPMTLKTVNLANLKQGDFVNIETDIIAKYIESIVKSKSSNSKISYNLLMENGFI